MKFEWEELDKSLNLKNVAYLLKVDDVKRAVLTCDTDSPDQWRCIMKTESIKCSSNLEEAKTEAENHFKNKAATV